MVQSQFLFFSNDDLVSSSFLNLLDNCKYNPNANKIIPIFFWDTLYLYVGGKEVCYTS